VVKQEERAHQRAFDISKNNRFSGEQCFTKRIIPSQGVHANQTAAGLQKLIGESSGVQRKDKNVEAKWQCQRPEREACFDCANSVMVADPGGKGGNFRSR